MAITYTQWLTHQKTINDAVNISEKELKEITGKTNGGLISDTIKSTKEYQAANSKFNHFFRELREFNRSSPKSFQKRKAQETRSKWSK